MMPDLPRNPSPIFSGFAQRCTKKFYVRQKERDVCAFYISTLEIMKQPLSQSLHGFSLTLPQLFFGQKFENIYVRIPHKSIFYLSTDFQLMVIKNGKSYSTRSLSFFLILYQYFACGGAYTCGAILLLFLMPATLFATFLHWTLKLTILT